jgi:hypothetical protein
VPQLLRQIVLNRQPHANDVDSVIFVPQEISYGAQVGFSPPALLSATPMKIR